MGAAPPPRAAYRVQAEADTARERVAASGVPPCEEGVWGSGQASSPGSNAHCSRPIRYTHTRFVRALLRRACSRPRLARVCATCALLYAWRARHLSCGTKS